MVLSSVLHLRFLLVISIYDYNFRNLPLVQEVLRNRELLT